MCPTVADAARAAYHCGMMTLDQIARLKITLDAVKPAVMRRVEVPLAIKLSDLHVVIQVTMPWWNDHPYEFRVRDINRRYISWGIPVPEWDFADSLIDASKTTLLDVLEDTGTKSLKYMCGFCNSWEHTVKVERIAAPEHWNAYPRLLAAQRRCPPEDVGGPSGYAGYLEAMVDAGHERHAEMIAWRGRDFDAEIVDATTIEKELAKLTKRWSRRKPKASRKLI